MYRHEAIALARKHILANVPTARPDDLVSDWIVNAILEAANGTLAHPTSPPPWNDPPMTPKATGLRYHQFIERGWTPAQLVEHGYMTAQPPLPMVLHCPQCGEQHIDAPEPANGWDNPPHRSHKCHECGTIWRPADVHTVGVAATMTHGQADTYPLRPNTAQSALDLGELTSTEELVSGVGYARAQAPDPNAEVLATLDSMTDSEFDAAIAEAQAPDPSEVPIPALYPVTADPPPDVVPTAADTPPVREVWLNSAVGLLAEFMQSQQADQCHTCEGDPLLCQAEQPNCWDRRVRELLAAVREGKAMPERKPIAWRRVAARHWGQTEHPGWVWSTASADRPDDGSHWYPVYGE